jgi:hypothetical protein
MEKPPFQFGLKAVFAVMTAVAVFAAVATGASPFLKAFVMITMAALLYLVFLYAVWTLAGWLLRLNDHF